MLKDTDQLLFDRFNRLFDDKSIFTINNNEYDVKKAYYMIAKENLTPEQKIYLTQDKHKFVFYLCKAEYPVRNVIDKRHFSDIYNLSKYFRENLDTIEYLVINLGQIEGIYYYMRLNKIPYENNKLRFNIDRSKRIQVPRNIEFDWSE